MQLLNPKVIIYGLTLYSAFMHDMVTLPFGLIVSALAFAAIGFCAISTWVLFGTGIRTYLHHPRINWAFNATLSLMLVGTAVDLSGILDYLFS
ncbi:MAG: hypothetical protein GY943_38245 [Chloroflexi bacterium]|nr:hypothetical protein [Chloroflexota bacterium]